jgi:hypothetical protein
VYTALKSVSPLLYGLEVIFLPEVVKNLFSEKQCCRFCSCIQNQIIHKHLHVVYNPLQGMLVLIFLTTSGKKITSKPYSNGDTLLSAVYTFLF